MLELERNPIRLRKRPRVWQALSFNRFQTDGPPLRSRANLGQTRDQKVVQRYTVLGVSRTQHCLLMKTFRSSCTHQMSDSPLRCDLLFHLFGKYNHLLRFYPDCCNK